MTTSYAPKAGKDPTWDAYNAKYDYQKGNYQADADLQKQQADDAYQQALAKLDQRSTYGKRAVDTAMLSRGVYASGETGRRQSELQSAILGARADAEAAKANAFGQISSTLTREMTALDLDREAQIAQSMGRGSGGGGVRRSGGGGGSTRDSAYGSLLPPGFNLPYPTPTAPPGPPGPPLSSSPMAGSAMVTPRTPRAKPVSTGRY